MHTRAIGADIPAHRRNVVSAPADVVLHLVYGAAARRRQDMHSPMMGVATVVWVVNSDVERRLVVRRIVAAWGLRRGGSAVWDYPCKLSSAQLEILTALLRMGWSLGIKNGMVMVFRGKLVGARDKNGLAVCCRRENDIGCGTFKFVRVPVSYFHFRLHEHGLCIYKLLLDLK